MNYFKATKTVGSKWVWDFIPANEMESLEDEGTRHGHGAGVVGHWWVFFFLTDGNGTQIRCIPMKEEVVLVDNIW